MMTVQSEGTYLPNESYDVVSLPPGAKFQIQNRWHLE